MLKDLRILGRDLRGVIMVDNTVSCMVPQLDNAIPVKSYYGDDGDLELYELEKILLQLTDK